MWRECHTGDWAASAAELSRDLATLHVPHETVVAFRPPWAREVHRRKGQEVRVPFAELAKLVCCVPSLQQPIDELPADAPGFTFAYCEPRSTGMAMMVLFSLAAEWPAWTAKRAKAMGLMCAECRFDLRTRGAAAARLQHPRPAGLPAPGVRGLLRQWTGRAEAPDRPVCWMSGAYGRPITPLSTLCRRKRAGAQNRGRRQLPATTAGLARTARSHTHSCGSRLTPPGHPAVLGAG